MIFDLIAGMNAGGGAAAWTPADLFQNGEEGFWLDGSDYSTMSQSRTAQVDVNAAGQPVGQWKNKIAGQTIAFDFVSASDSARPLTKTTSGKMSLAYDGVDDIQQTNAVVLVSGNQLSTFVGMKTGGVVSGRSVYLSANGTNNTIIIQANQTTIAQALGQSVTSTELYSITGSNILGLLAGVSTKPITVRVNGIEKTGSIPTTGTIGANIKVVGSAVLYAEISQMVFINRVLTPTEIMQLETFIGSKQ